MRRFGLIGYPLTHSFSEKYFTEKFGKEQITGCRYDLFPLKTIEQLPGLLKEIPEIEGLNVTIPYKKQVLSFLNTSRIPAGLEACNCINIENGQLIGYNTDITGFQKSLQPFLKAHHKNALILGNGGAALAVAFVLKRLGVGFHIVSRKPEDETMLGYKQIDKTMMAANTLIINTTPLGMFPDIETCPNIPYKYITADHLLYDLVYNPAKTMFLKKGEEKGAAIKNGEEMLSLQAEESWRIWNQ